MNELSNYFNGIKANRFLRIVNFFQTLTKRVVKTDTSLMNIKDWYSPSIYEFEVYKKSLFSWKEKRFAQSP